MSQTNVRFIDCTLQSYLNLQEKDSSAIYIVSTDTSFNNTEAQHSVPNLIFKGDKLISNSGLLTRYSTNGFISLESNVFSVTISNEKFVNIELNTNIIPGTVVIKSYTTEEHTDTPVIFIDNAISNTGTTSAYIKSQSSGNDVALIDYSTGLITFDNITDTTLKDIGNARLITISYNNQINIINADALSTNILGVPGQTLFIIDEFTNSNGLTSKSTYLYFWEQLDGSSSGSWKNANINYVNRMSIGDRELTSAELERLLELLY